MDGLSNLPAAERRIYFEQAAARLGYLTPQLIEKDFWVCWILKRVFELDEFSGHLTFKGGTSLSKVYNIIDRFSEDVDLSIDREFLGFGGQNEPERGQSGKEQQRRIARLKQACQECLALRFIPQLRQEVSKKLKPQQEWELIADVDDSDSQSLRFRFPAAVMDQLSSYFAPTIKLEFGARSDHYPVHSAQIQPYVFTALSDVIEDDTVCVRVLDGERTFWEKATILHALCYQAIDQPLRKRQSRHFYDLFQLANDEIGGQALRATDLLIRVAEHKTVFSNLPRLAMISQSLEHSGSSPKTPDFPNYAPTIVTCSQCFLRHLLRSTIFWNDFGSWNARSMTMMEFICNDG